MITVNRGSKIKNRFAQAIKDVFNGNPYHEQFAKNKEGKDKYQLMDTKKNKQKDHRVVATR